MALQRPNPEQTWEQLDADVRRWQVLVGHAYVQKVTHPPAEGGSDTQYHTYHCLNPYEVVERTDKETGEVSYLLLQKGGMPPLLAPAGSVTRLIA